MTLARGRVLRNPGAAATPVSAFAPLRSALPEGRVVERESVAAHERAAKIIVAAERRARAILEHAERGAADARLRAEEIGRAEGLARVAAFSARQRKSEADADERALSRTVDLARLLAERLLGRALAMEPALVLELAREVLAEVRSARRVRLFAHPGDVEALRASTRAFDPDGRVQQVIADPSLSRGDLRVETELGVVDARLPVEFERLSKRLREALRT